MSFISVEGHVVNLEMVSAAHWENDKLFVHLSGGRWLTFSGKPAESIWQALQASVGSPVVQGSRQ